MLNPVDLGKNGIIFIRNELSKGGDLSELILKLNLENGNATTYLPSGIEPNDINDFNESLNYISNLNVKGEIENLVMLFISDYLDSDENNIAVFETIWEKGDPIISKRKLNFFYFGSRKYDYVWGKTKSKRMKDYFIDAQGYPTIVILSKLIKKDYIRIQASEVDKSFINEIIINTDWLIIGAFDGEGFILWKKGLVSAT